MNELIVVKQLPIIEERLKALSEQIDQRVNNAISLVCTEETVKMVKAERAQLNKEFQSLEEQRKAVKAAVMNPYEQLEGVYKEYVSDKFKKADSTLKSRIDEVESELKEQKQQEVKAYFDEYLLSHHIDFATFENANINVTLSASMKSLKEQAKAFIDRICDDLALIETQEHKAEILVEYRRSLNVSQAITSVTERHRALEAEKFRQEEAAARKAAEAERIERVEAAIPEPLAPPTVENRIIPESEAIFTVSFRATASRAKLKALKDYMEREGIKYE